jgi:hypothetical protein
MGTLYATVTVDWEGEQITELSLQALENFKAIHPNIPLTHFICPAYFTRGDDLSEYNIKIKALTQNDEIGVHVHCWETLMRESHVEPITKPTCLTQGLVVKYGNGKEDRGFDVPLGVHSEADIRKILTTAKQILLEQGLTTPETCVSFRCGAWMACDTVFSALQKEGFKNDASAAPSDWLPLITEKELPIFASWMRTLWGKDETTTPNYLANTLNHTAYPEGVVGCFTADNKTLSMPQLLKNNIVEVPDTGALMDYTPKVVLYNYIQNAWNLSKNEDIYISFGFHLESAHLTNESPPGASLIMGLMQVLSKIKQEKKEIVYLTINQVGEQIRNKLG